MNRRSLLKSIDLGLPISVKPSPRAKLVHHPLWPEAKTLGEVLDKSFTDNTPSRARNGERTK